MAPRYLTGPAFDAWSRDTIQADATVKTAAIVAAEAAMDNLLSRRIAVAGAASARVFSPPVPGTQVLWIDDCTTVTSVVENGTTLTVTTDYQLEPLNGLSPSGEARPYSSIRRFGGSWYYDQGKALITVTATWGWTAVPVEIVEAVKVLAADWLAMRNSRNGVIAVSADGFSIGARRNPLVESAVQAYRSHKSYGIA